MRRCGSLPQRAMRFEECDAGSDGHATGSRKLGSVGGDPRAPGLAGFDFGAHKTRIHLVINSGALDR